jgi:hypothetical protein
MIALLSNLDGLVPLPGPILPQSTAHCQPLLKLEAFYTTDIRLVIGSEVHGDEARGV